MAMKNNAVLAINGAAYAFNKSSYIIRDGIVYRDNRLDCAPLVIKLMVILGYMMINTMVMNL